MEIRDFDEIEKEDLKDAIEEINDFMTEELKDMTNKINYYTEDVEVRKRHSQATYYVENDLRGLIQERAGFLKLSSKIEKIFKDIGIKFEEN